MEFTNDNQVTVGELRRKMAEFVRERDWEQFHNAKNLAMALASEAGELLEPFLWLEAKELDATLAEPAKRKAIEDELADVFLYGLAFANATQIDISAAIERKMAQNAEKYPIERAKGRADKYTEL